MSKLVIDPGVPTLPWLAAFVFIGVTRWVVGRMRSGLTRLGYCMECVRPIRH